MKRTKFLYYLHRWWDFWGSL